MYIKERDVMKKLIVISLLSNLAIADGWDSSPFNFDNSEYNFDNSKYNFNNSKYNFDNSPYNLNSDRIIRSPSGKPYGYIVPKANGGANVFDLKGNRKGYVAD